MGFFWLFENSSTLLYHCGLNIIKQIIDHLLKSENLIYLVRYLTYMFIVESKQVALNRINSKDKIMNSVYEYLKASVHADHFESILTLIQVEFLNIARMTENFNEEREFLETRDIIGGIIQFYELRLKKRI